MTNQAAAANWSEQQRTTFSYQMAVVQKDEVLGVLLAIFLGSFGLHHFYLRRNGLGILYLIFFWSGLPGLIALLESFFMPGRVRQYNAQQAAMLAESLGPANGPAVTMPAPYATQNATCPACGTVAAPGAKFCGRCGSAVFAN